MSEGADYKNMELKDIQNVDISLNLKKIPINGKDEETNKQVKWFLVELTAEGREDYLELIRKNAKYDDKGKPSGLSSLKGMYTNLLVRCLQDEQGAPIPIKQVNSLPSEAQEILFQVANKLNGFGERAEEDAKNS